MVWRRNSALKCIRISRLKPLLTMKMVSDESSYLKVLWRLNVLESFQVISRNCVKIKTTVSEVSSVCINRINVSHFVEASWRSRDDTMIS
jgi:hypothetical protein